MADVAVEAVCFVPVDFASVVEFVGLFSRVVEVVEFPLAHRVIDVARIHGEDFIIGNTAFIDEIVEEFDAEAQPSAPGVVAVFVSSDRV